MRRFTRRRFVQGSAGWTAAMLAGRFRASAAAREPASRMSFGLVTYMWGHDWDLPTLIGNCQQARALGVELRTTHAHGVEPSLNDRQRAEVRKRFADSDVTLVGLGSNERFDNPDPARVKQAIETSKRFLQLSHDVGSSGVKVKPDRFHPDVPRAKTIAQIGRALNELGRCAADLAQQVRLEVHGQCAELPTIEAIMDVADHPQVTVCWNSNAQDLQGDGLKSNFRRVRARFGATVHVRELDSPDYPYQQLVDLLVETDYGGWLLLEASSKPRDRVAALARQVRLLDQMVARAKAA